MPKQIAEPTALIKPARVRTATTLPIDEPTQAISIQLTNLTAKDARFLTEVIKLFCDPAYKDAAELTRRGRVSLQCDKWGELHITNNSMAYLHS